MIRSFSITLLILLTFQVKAQNTSALRNALQNIIKDKKLTAAIAVKSVEGKDTLSINGDLSTPMLSVFKFHIGLTVLDLVDKGELSLSQKLFIKKETLMTDTWSPMYKDYPNGNMTLTLDQVMRYTVTHSDNNGCDILLNLLGGTQTVQHYINSKGIKDFSIKVNEDQMRTWENVYINQTTAKATAALLQQFYEGKILQKKTTAYLYSLMQETSTGSNWLKAGLPKGTEFAHRTGTSGSNKGLTAALNDVGIVTLPNGKHYIICVFLSNMTETKQEAEKLLAEISAMTYKYFVP